MSYPATTWKRWTTLTIEEMQSLWEFRCKDPWSILGCHPLETDQGLKTTVRVYHPSASFITAVLEDGAEFDLVKIGDTGFFEAILDSEYEHLRYQLQVQTSDGHNYTTYDPYAFGPVLTDFDLHLLGKGTHYELYHKLGANIVTHDRVQGVLFAVWAPSAQSVSVVGAFNSWDGRRNPMRERGSSGVWEIFIPSIGAGELYRFEVHGSDGRLHTKVDPLAKWSEKRPATASIVVNDSKYSWNDKQWMSSHRADASFGRPMNIYEVHLGSWRKDPADPQGFLSYRQIADLLVPYVVDMGYTHVELLPVMEHPLDESWGYQVTGYFSPTSRFGTPDEFRYLVDQLHQAGVGVILDWVPAHFPMDPHALGRFDGSACYEHADPRQGEHPHWGTYIPNFGRIEVSNFLISNAMYWVREFHADGLRVDAVASLLYLDYGKGPGEWVPNKDGGNINYDAIEFLKHLNSILGKHAPHAMLIAEESTSFPCITRPPEQGGLGFHFKWNMGWMNDFLSYMHKEPIHRRWHHNSLTFSMIYAYSENFILVLSHDEVVHGKGSLLDKMPGDWWQKFANLRLAYSFMMAHPGKKLLFMGSEFAQYIEWNAKQSLDWHLTSWEPHRGVQQMVKALNHIYLDDPAFWELDVNPGGFEWIHCDDAENSIVSMVRKSNTPGDQVLCIFNFTPVPRLGYRVGAPIRGVWREVFNSDSQIWGGSNVGNLGHLATDDIAWQGRSCSLSVNLPPLGAVYFKFDA